MMERTPVPAVTLTAADVPALQKLPRASSNVEAWAYQPAQSAEGFAADKLGRVHATSESVAARLWVRYKGGSLYRYWGVPPILWETLQVATSIGGILHVKVTNNPDYPCERVVLAEATK
jgi:hypothetical protein